MKVQKRSTWMLVSVLGILVLLAIAVIPQAKDQTQGSNVTKNIKLNELTPEEERVIVQKGTEMPYSGQYEKFNQEGTYVCKWCDTPLYHSSDKFDAGCGWPSFDDEIDGAVKRSVDADGFRTEITCVRCGAHLGHVFEGEHLTDKNVRHCVNSISLKFIPKGQDVTTEKAYFAGGCFWGVEHLLEKQDGVLSVTSGFMGGHKDHPSYQDVCTGRTGHAETVEVEFDPSKIDYETLAKLFFEIHDPTQMDRQGPDVGDQYRSAVFYVDDNQKEIVKKLIGILKDKGYDVVTEVDKASTFWTAEDYHQNYYVNHGKEPYCHAYTKRF